MTRRRLLLALGAALAVLVLAGVVWRSVPHPPSSPGISQANCARIKPGMRLDEVDAILEGPAGVYNDGVYSGPVGWMETGNEPGREWVGNGLIITVYFDEDRRVQTATFAYLSDPSLWQQLLDCLRRVLP